MKFTSIITVAAFMAILGFSMTCAAESINTEFEQANKAFSAGNYEKAIGIYSKLDTLGVENADLFYNLGTAHSRLGHWGKAIQQYERALKIDPTHEDTRHNLSTLREFIAHRANKSGRDALLSPPVTPWRAMMDRFSPAGASWAFLILHSLFFIALMIRRIIGAEMPRLTLGVAAGILGILSFSMLSITIGKWHAHNFVKEAIIINDGQTQVMEGPDSTVKRFILEEGSRVELVQSQGRWTRLHDAEGRDGWVPTKTLGEI